ncbi:MAG: hypothetical protein NDJ75_02460 [Thermoanaerobaculia bacterium]|nr:hypothetical protein [Thermoanaerobaculia bacterium]
MSAAAAMRGGAWLLAAALAAACGDGEARPRAPFTAVWLAADSALPTRAELTRLAAAGALELFVEAAELRLDGDLPRLVPLPVRRLQRETPVTLVVVGTWSAPPASPRAIASAWRASLAAMELAAREAGGVPVGVHFDLAVTGGGGELAATLARLRRELRGGAHLSLALPAAPAVDAEALAALLGSVDFVTAEGYGQAPDVADDASRWDLERTAAVLAATDRLGVPYAVTAWTLGSAELRPRRGEPTAFGAGLPLARLLRAPQFSPRPGAVFAGVDRQVFELEAREPTAVGPRALVRGDRLRVARPTTHDLESLLELVASTPSPRRRGLVFRQLPAAGDLVSPGAVHLAAALEPGAATPELAVELVPEGARGGRLAVRVRLRNLGAEATELGGGEWNYVQIEFRPGALGRVATGDFVGWEQLWRGSERRTLRALREADTLRLFASYVGAGETLESGPVELRAAAGERPPVYVSGRFILPGGRELAITRAPAQWVDRD